MAKSKLIAEQIKKIRPLLKEASPEQKLKLMKLMKVALKEGFNERQALIQKIASTGEYDVSDLELASDEELEQLLADENQEGVAEGSESSDNLVSTLNSFGYYSDNGNVYVNDDSGDKIARQGSNWKHQSGKRGAGAEELGEFLGSEQGVAEGYGDGREYGGAYVNGRSDDARMTEKLTRQAKAAAAKAGKTFSTSAEYRLWHMKQKSKKQGVAESSDFLDEK